MESEYNGAVGQDLFALKCLKFKKNGTFIEIGSHHPKRHNNTFLLETKHRWTGIMIEKDKRWLSKYKRIRPKSKHIIKNACNINYKQLFINNKIPKHIDFLSFDLEVTNNSTLECLQKMDKEVLKEYKFATITFEHDIYRGNYFNTREESRKIFDKYGYYRVFPDVMDGDHKFEDWYVHPDLVDMDYIKNIDTKEGLYWKKIVFELMT